MRKSKLVLSMLLTGVMGMSLLVGCGSESKQTSSTSGDGKTKEFTAFFATAGKDMPDTNRVKNAIDKKIGATIKETWLTGQTAKERVGVMIAGGEYSDFIEGGDGTQALIDAGALVPLEDKLDKYPNLKKYLTAVERKKLTKADGHIYYIPQFSVNQGKETDTGYGGEAFWIQKAVLEWAKFPKIQTLDQYFDLIEKYKEANPTINGQPTVGFDILSEDTRYFCLENPPQFLAGYANDGKAIVDKKTLTAHTYETIPEAQQYYKKLNEEYNKGIVDQETFTASYDQYKSKISTGRVLGLIDQHWQFQDAEATLRQQDLDERTYVPLPLTIDPNVTPRYRTKKDFNAGGGLAITTSCKDVDGALKVMNDLLSPEVEILRTWGEKDTDYKVDDKGVFSRTEEQRQNNRNQDWTLANMCGYSYFPGIGGMLADGINCASVGDQPDEFWSTLRDTDKNILTAYGYKRFTDFMNVPPEENEPWFPIWSFTGSLTADDPAGIAMQKMDEIKKQWLPKVIMAKTSDFDSSWKEYQTTLTTKADTKAYEEALTKEVKRRTELFSQK